MEGQGLETKDYKAPSRAERLAQLEAELEAMTPQERAQKLLETQEMADRDPLTEVLNRRAFLREGKRFHEHAKRKGEPYAVAFFDLDNFKYVNDTFGHEAGDEVLRALADSLGGENGEGSLRDTDLLARMGGDEFAALLVDYNQERAGEAFPQRVKEKFKSKLSERFGSDHPITNKAGVSIGVTLWRGEEFQEVVRQADAKMYQLKEVRKSG